MAKIDITVDDEYFEVIASIAEIKRVRMTNRVRAINFGDDFDDKLFIGAENSHLLRQHNGCSTDVISPTS